MFQRAIPLRSPVVQVRSGDGLDGRRRIGLNPAEGDVGTADAPGALRHASLATQPDEGGDTALGESVAAATRRGQQIGGSCSRLHPRPIAIALVCPSALSQSRATAGPRSLSAQSASEARDDPRPALRIRACLDRSRNCGWRVPRIHEYAVLGDDGRGRPDQPTSPRAPLVATSRKIAALFVQPFFPDCTGIVETKRSPPDRAESSSLAESAASAAIAQQ